MNAYAGSLAWSNFFSRLTHSHPGRVVWLLFNVGIALLLMELGIYRLLEETLGIFSIIAMAWLCTISADLFVNKPLGLAPPGIEFKRAHLYDINPVGLGSMLLSRRGGADRAFRRLWRDGRLAGALYRAGRRLHRLAAIAWATKGKYYLARKPRKHWQNLKPSPARSANIPSSPRTWPGARPMPRRSARSAVRSTAAATTCASRMRISAQTRAVAQPCCPRPASTSCKRGSVALASRSHFAGADRLILGDDRPPFRLAPRLTRRRWWAARSSIVFFVFAVVAGIVVCWFYVLAHDSRRGG
jgi:hypothetical protein